MSIETINIVLEEGLCTGCGTCIAICPKDAITYHIDKQKGVYRPNINQSRCASCGICLKSCPGQGVDFQELNLEIFGKNPENRYLGNFIGCYHGFSNNLDLRYSSSSGGLITQILLFALDEGIIDGAIVTRMSRSNPLEPEAFIARTREEILEAKGSKYCPVPVNLVLKEVMKSCENEKLAFVGLPCHLQGLRKVEKINKKIRQKIVLHLGIVCSQTPNFNATEFLLKKLKLNKEDIQSIHYRGNGWPGSLRICTKSEEHSMPHVDSWSSGFGQFFYPYRCTLCFDHTAEFSDISFADAWIPEIKESDSIGSSLIIIRDQRLLDLLISMCSKNIITLNPVSEDKVILSQKYPINFKKEAIFTRISLLSSFGFKVPDYNITEHYSENNGFSLRDIRFYIKLNVYSKKYLWPILIILGDIKRYISLVYRRYFAN
jgi:coenzyme F420 hydrogenase subunit beta